MSRHGAESGACMGRDSNGIGHENNLTSFDATIISQADLPLLLEARVLCVSHVQNLLVD